MRCRVVPATIARPGRRAFTLVELLVVIGIISVLVAMLLPVLNRVRDAANNTACQSNLRQIYLASEMYALDNRDRFPHPSAGGDFAYRRAYGEDDGLPPIGGEGGPEIYGFPSMFQRLGYMPGRGSVWVCPSIPDLMEYGNTYVVGSIAGSSYLNNGDQRFRRRFSNKQRFTVPPPPYFRYTTVPTGLAQTEWVSDHVLAFSRTPRKTGSLSGSIPTVGPTSISIKPHRLSSRWNNDGARTHGYNSVFMDGHVQTRPTGGVRGIEW